MAYANPEDQRAAARLHYEANSSDYKRRAKAHTASTKISIRHYINEYLATHPCVDCGESDGIVLEFDHRDASKKSFNIGNFGALGKSLKSVMAEIEKCDVRCANCHRRRTHAQRLAGEFSRH